ncbi:MAG TPA: hypothetical protein VMG41_02100 [Gemmatimonadales bacterium]|nr:hypothetical protein [Gemmatimonadales bacterium]
MKGHLHHRDVRAAFAQVRRRQATATLLAACVLLFLLLILPAASGGKLPAVVLAGLLYGLFTHRNWRCPQCRSLLPYGRIPREFTCPRCAAVLYWGSARQ